MGKLTLSESTDERLRAPESAAEWRGYPATLAFGSAVRQAIQAAAIDRMVCPDDTADIVLAASEAFANAVRHGNSSPGDAVWLCQQWGTEEVTLRLRYRGAPFEADELHFRDADRLQGRGRTIMHRLLDHVEYRFADGWTEVELVRRLRPARRLGAPR
jgi:anti-sigma regulatory factor (Ser/Thr protein kinase)